MKTSIVWLTAIAACGGGTSSSSGGGGGSPDAAAIADSAVVSADAPVTSADAPAASADAPSGSGPGIPATITITGTSYSEGNGGRSALGGVAIAFFRADDEATPIATTTSNAQGEFSVSIATDGSAVVGFARGELSGYVDDYAYPPAPLTADFHGEIDMVTSQVYQLLGTVYHQGSDNGLIIADVLDGSGAPLAGATITSTPAATYRYSQGSAGPAGTTSTSSDGLGYFLNADVGAVAVTAHDSGRTFATTSVKARAHSLTTTFIVTP